MGKQFIVSPKLFAAIIAAVTASGIYFCAMLGITCDFDVRKYKGMA